MRIGPLRLVALAAVLLALVAPAASLAGPRAGAGDRGVVQAIDAQHIVLKALDGTQVSFAVSPFTQIRVNGARATVTDVEPGFVADVVADGKGRALAIRAYGGPAATATDRGVVTAVTKTSITIAPDGGGAPLTLVVDRNTKLKVQGGGGVRKGMLRPGVVVVVSHTIDGPALVITILKRTGA